MYSLPEATVDRECFYTLSPPSVGGGHGITSTWFVCARKVAAPASSATNRSSVSLKTSTYACRAYPNLRNEMPEATQR